MTADTLARFTTFRLECAPDPARAVSPAERADYNPGSSMDMVAMVLALQRGGGLLWRPPERNR